MNSKKLKPFLFLTVLFCVICSSLNVNAQQTQNGKPVDKIILAEQIPETMLTIMPTEQLIQKYLNSRYSRYIFLYPDDINYAFEKAYNDFNGLRELLKRQDVAKNLIEIYQRMDPGAYENGWEPVKKGQFAFSFAYVELLLAQGSILDSFTKSETKTILMELLKKHEVKILHRELYSMFDIQFNTYSIAKLLESKGKNNGITQTLQQTPGMNDFFNRGILINKEVFTVVIQKAKEFVKTY